MGFKKRLKDRKVKKVKKVTTPVLKEEGRIKFDKFGNRTKLF